MATKRMLRRAWLIEVTCGHERALTPDELVAFPKRPFETNPSPLVVGKRWRERDKRTFLDDGMVVHDFLVEVTASDTPCTTGGLVLRRYLVLLPHGPTGFGGGGWTMRDFSPPRRHRPAVPGKGA
jgi:hypothetical protein